MSNLVPIRVSLTDANKKKLAGGSAIRLKHHQLKDGDLELHVSAKKAKKIAKACRCGKGVTLDMNSQEYKTNGGKLDWGKVKRGLKDFGKAAIRGGIKAAAATLGELAGGPVGAMAATAASTPLADYAVRKSGLGMKEVATYSTLGLARGYIPDTSGSGFLGPAHPASNPGHRADPRLPDNSGSRHRVTRGGSFKPAGGYGVPHLGVRHPAHMPMVAHSDLPCRM